MKKYHSSQVKDDKNDENEEMDKKTTKTMISYKKIIAYSSLSPTREISQTSLTENTKDKIYVDLNSKNQNLALYVFRNFDSCYSFEDWLWSMNTEIESQKSLSVQIKVGIEMVLSIA